jgi:hypothetical protein
MVFHVLRAELDNVRVPIGSLCLDLVEDFVRGAEFCVGLHPVAIVFGGVAILNEKIRL